MTSVSIYYSLICVQKLYTSVEKKTYLATALDGHDPLRWTWLDVDL